MTSVNVTTQSNTVTVQQGDATTVTIATQGPQGPAGVGSSDIVDDTSPQLGGDLQSNGNDINFADNDKAIFGTGSDLQIFHDSANSYIKDNGTGQLRLQTNELLVINPALDENILKASADGAVELYHNGTKKVETSANGLDMPDNSNLQIGDNQDLQLFHNGTRSEIKSLNVNNFTIRQQFAAGFMFIHSDQLHLRSHSTNEIYIACTNNGSVDLYHDNVKKVETTADGVDVQGQIHVLGTVPQLRLNSDTNDGSTTRAMFGMATSANNFVNGSTVNDVVLNCPKDFIISHGTTDLMAVFKDDGAVELYHDNVKRLETKNYGVNIQGALVATNSVKVGSYTGKLQVGVSNELQLSHDDTDSFIENAVGNLHIRPKTSEEGIKLIPDGAVELYFDNGKKAETTSTGFSVNGTLVDLGATHFGDVQFTGDNANIVFDKSDNALEFADNAELKLGSAGEVRIFHTGSATNFIVSQHYFNLQANGYFFYNQAGNETLFSLEQNGAVKLYYDNAKKAETSSTGFDIPADFIAGSGSKLTVGASQDLTFFHDSTNSYVQNHTGDLILGDTNHQYFRGNTSDKSVSLYFNGSEKAKTTNSGITVTGSVTTQDMNMSNLNGTANEVDNTKGSWSIQEGADDLFLINRVSGKKYKFNLTEVS